MASFSSLAAELRLQILESCDDFRNLLCLVSSSNYNKELYQKHAKTIITAVMNRCPYADQMQDTLQAHFSEGSMKFTIPAAKKGPVNFTLPADKDIWASGDQFRSHPSEILRFLADTEHEIGSLAEYCLGDPRTTQGFRVKWVDGTRRMTAEEYSTALWELKRYIARSHNLSRDWPLLGKRRRDNDNDNDNTAGGSAAAMYPAANPIAALDEQRRDMMRHWLRNHDYPALEALYIVLRLLQTGNDHLSRAGRGVREGSVLQQLFTTSCPGKGKLSGEYWTQFLGDTAFGVLALRARRRRVCANVNAAVDMLRSGGMGEVIQGLDRPMSEKEKGERLGLLEGKGFDFFRKA